MCVVGRSTGGCGLELPMSPWAAGDGLPPHMMQGGCRLFPYMASVDFLGWIVPTTPSFQCLVVHG